MANTRLSDLASIAEVISGIAVVVTLVFLVLGIRENTEINRAAAYDRSIDAVNQWRFEVSQSPELARMYGAHEGQFGPDATVEQVDEFRLTLVVNAVWGIYENAYHANRYGLMGTCEWERFENQLCKRQDEAMASGRWTSIAAFMTEDFTSFVASLCNVP